VTRRRRAALLALVAVALAACGGGRGGSDAAGTSTTTTGFDGDPRSPFCQRSRDAAAEPVEDPFEAGLEPAAVELRFDALVARFDRLAAVAPEPLAEDLDLLEQRLGELRQALDGAGYDFEQLVQAGVDLSLFDDPALADVADRLSAYQSQVCDL